MIFSHALNSALLSTLQTPNFFSKRTGLNENSVNEWIQGHRLPSPDKMIIIAHAFEESGEDIKLTDDYLRDIYYSSNNKKIDFSEEYSFKREFQKLFFKNKWLGHNLNSINRERIDYLSRLYSKVNHIQKSKVTIRKDKILESETIILPKPEIILLDNWADIAKKIAQSKLNLSEISWENFEDFIGYLLEQYGWKIIPMGRTKDEGIDLIAIQDLKPNIPFRMMVQCKRHKLESKVGLSVVKEVWSTKWEKGFHQAMIATTSFFTKGAIEKGELWDLQLRDHDNILSWCKECSQIIL